ncbi:hypothetical protein Dimus_034011, partial [Dionaea muscipula]
MHHRYSDQVIVSFPRSRVRNGGVRIETQAQLVKSNRGVQFRPLFYVHQSSSPTVMEWPTTGGGTTGDYQRQEQRIARCCFSLI